jgi:hypothetical protein
MGSSREQNQSTLLNCFIVGLESGLGLRISLIRAFTSSEMLPEVFKSW